MSQPKRYVEQPERQSQSVFIDDPREFSRALGAFVIVCTDFVPICLERRTIYLAERRIQAAKGIWRFGGRQRPGETMQMSCVRLARHELKLEITPERFRWFLQTEELFSFRAQEPADTGVHDLINLFAIELSKSEIEHARLNLDPSEYDKGFGIREFDRRTLKIAHAQGKIRPQLLDMYDVLFPPT